MNQSNNYFTLTFIILILLCLSSSLGAHPHTGTSNFTRCDQLPRVASNFSLVIKYSPFHVYRSLDPTYNCTTGIGTGALKGSSYHGTFVILQQNVVKTLFGVFPETNDTAMTVFCDNGVQETYHFLIFNVSDESGYICPYICSDDGVSLTTIRCYGHSDEDEQHIQSALDKYANVPGFKNITNTQQNCNYGFVCNNYYF